MVMLQPNHVSHPILRLEVLSKGGTQSATERVFCRLRRKSTPVEVCAHCEHCDSIQRGHAPSVECTFTVPPGSKEHDPRGERTEVGALLSSGAVVVEQGASLGAALELLKDGERRSLAVVDVEQKLVGVLHEMTFVQRAGRHAHGQHRREQQNVTCAMSTAIAVHEAMSVRAALHLLASSHLREAVVVDSEGKPIGLFRDLDGMRWIARAARSPASPDR
jgi:CBS domain-containing protein